MKVNVTGAGKGRPIRYAFDVPKGEDFTGKQNARCVIVKVNGKKFCRVHNKFEGEKK